LSIRAEDERYGELTRVEQFGGEVGQRALVPALIASLTYRPGARWNPLVLPPGAGALALLANAIPAKSRPGQTLAAVGKAALGTVVLEGERGDAHAAAEALLKYVEQSAG
jgi:hypothetical protein